MNWSDTETEFSDLLKVTNSILHQHSLSTLQVVMATGWPITTEGLSLALHNGFSIHLKLSVNVAHLCEEFLYLPK